MKRIRKLRLQPTQELGMEMQQKIMAGSNEWIGGCTCVREHNSHLETKVEEVSDPDVIKALLGSAETAVGCFAVASGVATSGVSFGTSVTCVVSGVGMVFDGVDKMVSGAFRTAKVKYTREMELVSTNPWNHKQKKMTSSLL